MFAFMLGFRERLYGAGGLFVSFADIYSEIEIGIIDFRLEGKWNFKQGLVI